MGLCNICSIMVYFKVVESRTFLYVFIKKWFTWIMRYAYYRRFHMRGKENLPKKGTPVLIVSNHQNAVMDALAIDFSLPARCRMVFLARSDAFKKPFIAKILNFCKVMPIFRQRDGRDTLGGNQAIFEESAKLIGMGFPVALFPEGRHQEGHYLIPLKKGFARIAFETAEFLGFPDDMTVMPVGNHYSDYFSLRSDVCVNFGKPVPLKDYYALYRENPAKALLKLTEDIAPAIRALMLDIPDVPHYDTYDYLRTVVRGEIACRQGLRYGYLPDDLQADRFFAARIAQSSPEVMAEVREKTLRYKREVEALGISTREVEGKAHIGTFLKDFILLLIGLPFALYGFVFSGVPVLVGQSLSHRMAAKNKMLQSSINFVLGQLLLQGLFYLLYIILFVSLLPGWGAGALVCFLLTCIFTRALWQDYMHFAAGAFRRLRAMFMPRSVAALRPLRKELCDWVWEA